MSEAQAAPLASVSPIGDPSRPRRLKKVVVWLVGIAALVFVLQLLGVDIRGWLSDFWESVKDIPIGYLLAGLALQTVQTTFTALAWLFILRAAYPRAELPFGPILTALNEINDDVRKIITIEPRSHSTAIVRPTCEIGFALGNTSPSQRTIVTGSRP